MQNVFNILLLFLRLTVLSNCYDSLDFVRFQYMFIDARSNISDEKGSHILLLLQDKIGWSILISHCFLHQLFFFVLRAKLFILLIKGNKCTVNTKNSFSYFSWQHQKASYFTSSNYRCFFRVLQCSICLIGFDLSLDFRS